MTFHDMNQANQCAGVCKKSTFYLGTLLIAEKERRKRGPGSSKISGLFWILQTLFLSLLDPLQKIILVQIFNHIASHLSFNPQHTHGGLGAPQNRSNFKMISKCLAANLIHINLRQSMCQNPNIYKMQICTSGESSLQQVIIELNLV